MCAQNEPNSSTLAQLHFYGWMQYNMVRVRLAHNKFYNLISRVFGWAVGGGRSKRGRRSFARPTMTCVRCAQRRRPRSVSNREHVKHARLDLKLCCASCFPATQQIGHNEFLRRSSASAVVACREHRQRRSWECGYRHLIGAICLRTCNL